MNMSFFRVMFSFVILISDRIKVRPQPRNDEFNFIKKIRTNKSILRYYPIDVKELFRTLPALCVILSRHYQEIEFRDQKGSDNIENKGCHCHLMAANVGHNEYNSQACPSTPLLESE